MGKSGGTGGGSAGGGRGGGGYAAASQGAVDFFGTHTMLRTSIVDYTGASYRRTNELMREGMTKFSQKYGEKMAKHTLGVAQGTQRALNRAIEAGVTYTGTTYRGMEISKAELSKWTSSGTAVNRGIWSTSVSKSVAKQFSTNAVITIRKVRGVAVKGISMVPRENEVALPAGTRFKLVSVREVKGVHHITLEQK